jgi:RHS repeat-associated protein
MNLLPDLVEYDETEGYRLEQDPTGLINDGFRYRDPSTGTFLTRDPLGFKAGPNMYTYVRQNPWTNFDPEGLYPDAQSMYSPHPGAETQAWHQGAREASIVAVSSVPFMAIGMAGAPATGATLVGAAARAAYVGLQAGGAGAASSAISSGLHAQSPTLSGMNTTAVISAIGGTAAHTAAEGIAAANKATSAATSAPAASARTTGTATVMEHPGTPTHFSVNVDAGGTSLHTHQVATPGGASTAIVPAPKTPAMPVVASGTVNLPNATAAQAAQKAQMAAGNLGPYDKVNNSCVSHVSSVLDAGGVKTPAPGVPGPSAQLRNLKKIVNPPPPPPPKQ